MHERSNTEMSQIPNRHISIGLVSALRSPYQPPAYDVIPSEGGEEGRHTWGLYRALRTAASMHDGFLSPAPVTT
jgi:hypothetical protein